MAELPRPKPLCPVLFMFHYCMTSGHRLGSEDCRYCQHWDTAEARCPYVFEMGVRLLELAEAHAFGLLLEAQAKGYDEVRKKTIPEYRPRPMPTRPPPQAKVSALQTKPRAKGIELPKV